MGFRAGSTGASSSGVKPPVLRYRRQPSKWKRLQKNKRMIVVYKEKKKGENEEETIPKRKACEAKELETTSKIANKCDLDVVLHEKPPNNV